MLNVEPEEFASRWGIEFEEGADDLDFFRSSLIALDSGATVGLVRYARSPEPGTELHAPNRLQNTSATRHEFLNAFGLSEADVRWVLPEAAVARAAGS